MIRRVLLVAPAAVLLGALGWGLFRSSPELSVGRPAPALELRDLRTPDRTVTLASLRGRPVVLNFWASWCEPCKAEAPALEAAWREHGEAVTFLGVNILDGREEALAFMREYGLGFVSVRDPSGVVQRRFRVTGVPETVFVDAEGFLAGRFVGNLDEVRISRFVSRLLAGQPLRITGRGETQPVP